MEIAALVWIIVIASSIWVLFDALQICESKNLRKSLAVECFVSCIAIWIIAFPHYLATRGNLEKTANSSAGKWLMIFLGIMVIMVVVLNYWSSNY